MAIAPLWELCVYLVVIVYLHVVVFCNGFALSAAALGRVRLPGLARSWLPGSPAVDLSDAQWREFRRSLPLLAAAMAAFVIASHATRRLLAVANARTGFYISASLLFIGVVHGSYAVHVLTMVLLHYVAARALAGTRFGLAVLWALACALFVAVRATDGLPFRMLAPAGLAHALGQAGGMLRWHIHYNLLLLRMLSYGADLHWARCGGDGGGAGAHAARSRAAPHLALHMYSLANYLAFTLYPPLYIAGPIATFNAFAAQLQKPRSPSAKQLLLYALRWAAVLLALEVLTHTLYVNSIVTQRAWTAIEAAGVPLRPLHFAGSSYWVLVFMWLKFTVIWRFFRLVALADGFDVPENMTRCVCNNYTIQGFWRSWHASYNQWLVRYVYVPLGGSRWRALNVWAVFTFVALWHDLEWRLLSWAWIMAAFVAVELGAAALAARMARGAHTHVWRHACAAAGAANVLVLMTGNVVGFVVGPDGVVPLWRALLRDPAFVAGTLGALFAAVQLMRALREWEARRGGGAAPAAPARC